MACGLDPDIPPQWPHHAHQHPRYSPSNSSTASSTASSAFSIDAPSSQSSVAPSSVGWSGSAWQAENEVSLTSSQVFPLRRDSQSSNEDSSTPNQVFQKACTQLPSVVIPLDGRQNPRRTQRLNHPPEISNGQQTSQCPRAPPSLVRQSERKDNFVDSLVGKLNLCTLDSHPLTDTLEDTATQMIETIWPLSTLNCGRDATLGAKQQSLIGLRTFVQEVLRRSKTSYSTLQVALYYLILIQPSVPKHDFTMEQSEDTSACRAMQCGRRMFLAALILASKYLQDRNFSARAWSKISGLRTCEINSNELAFLSAVNWKLHIPEPIFHRWTDVVLRYSPSAHVNGPPRSSPTSPCSWKSLIPQLTPELDKIDDLNLGEHFYDSGYDSPGSDMSPPPVPMHEDILMARGSNNSTPTKPYTIPQPLEPTPRESNMDAQILPPLPRLGPLPTPQLTPQTGVFCTPAVGVSGFCPRRPSMSYAMGEIRRCELNRMTLDNPSDWRKKLPDPFPTSARRTSLAMSASSVSSPESTVSDRSSRCSRSSSVSSVASSNCALPPPRLAVQATRRCANMQLCGLKEEGDSTPQPDYSWPTWPSTQSRGSSAASTPQAVGSNCSGVMASTHEAASALRDLALNRQRGSQAPSTSTSPARSLKRSRTNSIDHSVVQTSVRDLLAQSNEEDSIVLPDESVADSFLLQPGGARLPKDLGLSKHPKPSLSAEGLPRKRTCAGSDRGGRGEARMHERSLLWASIA